MELYVAMDSGGFICRSNSGRQRSDFRANFRRSQECPRQKTQAFTGSSTKQFRPKRLESLFNQCLVWIVQHLGIVDSFCGLPDIIGKQLFTAAYEEHGVGISLRSVSLFVDAFPGMLLESLVCSSKLTREYLDFVRTVSPCLRYLSLHRCGLTDDAMLALHDLPNIVELRLNCNRLTDVGIQKLTARQRVRGTGLNGLESFDLAGNALLTGKTVLYLLRLPALQSLDLTNTSLSSKDEMDLLKKGFQHPCSEMFFNKKCSETSGWASKLATELCHRDDDAEDASKSSSFYGQPKRKFLPTPRITSRAVPGGTRPSSSHKDAMPADFSQEGNAQGCSFCRQREPSSPDLRFSRA